MRSHRHSIPLTNYSLRGTHKLTTTRTTKFRIKYIKVPFGIRMNSQNLQSLKLLLLRPRKTTVTRRKHNNLLERTVRRLREETICRRDQGDVKSVCTIDNRRKYPSRYRICLQITSDKTSEQRSHVVDWDNPAISISKTTKLGWNGGWSYPSCWCPVTRPWEPIPAVSMSWETVFTSPHNTLIIPSRNEGFGDWNYTFYCEGR